MSFIEGGGKFIDYINDFSTTDPVEWNQHKKESGIKVNGEMPCGSCKKQITLEGFPYGKVPFCEECKEELLR